jgi:transcriptional regulator with XRE-family HTH domain
MSFASRLKEFREHADLTFQQLASRAAKPGYGNIKDNVIAIRAAEDEDRARRPKAETLVHWCDALDLTDDETEELVARRMAERYGCGDAWEMWEMAAARVIREVQP